ncbi:hypothetical protein L9F63_021971, partial [Diploptera punctata]
CGFFTSRKTDGHNFIIGLRKFVNFCKLFSTRSRDQQVLSEKNIPKLTNFNIAGIDHTGSTHFSVRNNLPDVTRDG